MAQDMMRVDELMLMRAAYNPRKISARAFASLRRSIRQFGCVQPIVINRSSNRIIGGHQRVAAAQAEKIDSLPVIFVEIDEVAEKQLNVALNRIHGEFDDSLLANLLSDIQREGADLLDTGLMAKEVETLLASMRSPEHSDLKDEADPLADEPESRIGDVIELGRHVLVCGDSRDVSVLSTALGGRQAQCLWTDPPYGLDYVGKTSKKLSIITYSPDDLSGLLQNVFASLKTQLADSSILFISHPDGDHSITFRSEMKKAGWNYRQTLIWCKGAPVLGHMDYHCAHEPIAYLINGSGKNVRGTDRWLGGNAETTVFEIKKPSASRHHPTMKPVDLITAMLRNHVRRGDLVLDPFLGSGSTLIACEIIGVSCAAVELDPRYVDVAVKRWERFTGLRATVRGGIADQDES